MIHPSRASGFALAPAALLLLALAPAAARADDTADRAFAFSGAHGLLGCRELVDARSTEALDVRAGINQEIESFNTRGSGASYFKDLYAWQAIGGASALGLIDGGAKISVQHLVQRLNVDGTHTPHADSETGVSDLEVAGKVSFKLGWLSLGPYGTLELNSGAIRVIHTNTLSLGGAATLGLLEEKVAVHANLRFVDLNGGVLAFGYRLGASIAPLVTEGFTLRLVAYLDGLEYGRHESGSDVRFAGGVQAAVARFVNLELTTDFRVVESNLPRSFHDVGTYGIGLGAGANILF